MSILFHSSKLSRLFGYAYICHQHSLPVPKAMTLLSSVASFRLHPLQELLDLAVKILTTLSIPVHCIHSRCPCTLRKTLYYSIHIL